MTKVEVSKGTEAKEVGFEVWAQNSWTQLEELN